MAASTSMRPHSSTSSASSTPWLSPEPSSSTWRASYTNSADLSRRSSPSSSSSMDADPLSSRDPHSQEWWEHVLPPGQLAERLRKAQRASSASRRRNNPALANATPSERSAWKRLSGLPTEKRHHDRSESSTAASSRRSSFHGGAAATLPRSALKSSHRSQEALPHNSEPASQSGSSAEVSSDEFGSTPTGRRTPQNHHIRFAFPTADEGNSARSSRRAGVRTTANSPEMVSSASWSTASATTPTLSDAFELGHSFSRNTSGRRMRVMSEDGIASSMFTSAQSTSYSSSSSSYRLPFSQSAVHLSQLCSSNSSNSISDTSNWTGIAADRSRARLANNPLPDTPELSSDDGADATIFSTTTTQRVRKISTTKTTVRSLSSSTKAASPPAILRSHFDHPDQPPCTVASDDVDGYVSPASRRDRHVSFDQASENSRRSSVIDYTEPLTSSQSAFNFASGTGPFESMPPRSNSTRRPRQGVRMSGRRTTSFSLPNSRRGSLRGDSPFQQRRAAAAAASQGSGTNHHRRNSSIPDAMLLESLNVAHKQLASAGHMALTLTRQLSAPLRPVFHMTLFLSISSITVLSLACFLCASYMLTAWDDVSKRTNKVGAVAVRTKHRLEKTLVWGFRMLGPGEGSAGSGCQANEAASESKRYSTRDANASSDSTSKKAPETGRRGSVLAAGHAFLWPARMAFSGATKVAHTITPPGITKMFSEQKQHPAQNKGKGKASSLPPRPPLSTLLPSILFTLLLAVGAGLTSFLASRKAAAASADGRDASMHSGRGGAQPYSVPSASSSPGMQYVHLASSPNASPFAGVNAGKNFHSMRMNGQEGLGQRRAHAFAAAAGDASSSSSAFVR